MRLYRNFVLIVSLISPDGSVDPVALKAWIVPVAAGVDEIGNLKAVLRKKVEEQKRAPFDF